MKCEQSKSQTKKNDPCGKRYNPVELLPGADNRVTKEPIDLFDRLICAIDVDRGYIGMILISYTLSPPYPNHTLTSTSAPSMRLSVYSEDRTPDMTIAISNARQSG